MSPGVLVTAYPLTGARLALKPQFHPHDRAEEANLHVLIVERDVGVDRIELGEKTQIVQRPPHERSAFGLDYLGESRIVGPDGRDLACAGTEETLISARLDLTRIPAARSRLPYLSDLAGS